MWPTETPWPSVVICAIGAILALAFYQSRGQNRYLVTAGICVLLGVCAVIVDRQIVTPSEEVEQAVADLCATFQRESVAMRDENLAQRLLANHDFETLQFISAQATELQHSAERALRLVTVEDDFRLTDVIVETKAGNSRATSHFRVNGSISVVTYGSLGYKPSRWLLTWQREDGRWKVIRAERLDVITGEALDDLFSRK